MEFAMAHDPYTALAELAGGFIHEIKNHLGTLSLNLQLLSEDLVDPQTPRERRALGRVQKLHGECERLVSLSNDFLRFARIKDLSLTPTELGKVVEEMIDFFEPTAKMARIDLRTYIPADLPVVQLDVDLFKQALLNLLLNAEQAMPDGGSITLQATVESAGSGHCVCLMIIDTGKGIAADRQARIFEPFYSTRQGGSGLGLPTTKRIVEAHHGSIDVQSEPGKGTKFTIRLPVQ
jgi:two-component system, NtrC family, sensor histidine kinase HydH